MVKGVRPNINPNDDFAHKYAGGTNQYGTKGTENPNEFNGYLNDGMSPGAGEGVKNTPMDLMSTPHNPDFGPPNKVGPAAPENFGPPPVNEAFADNSASFGPPGSEGGNTLSLKAGGPDLGNTSKAGGGLESGNKGVGAAGDDGKGAGKPGDDGKGGEASSADKDKKYTYAKVEKMMIDAMLQKAMANMKIKSPDPSAWK